MRNTAVLILSIITAFLLGVMVTSALAVGAPDGKAIPVSAGGVSSTVTSLGQPNTSPSAFDRTEENVIQVYDKLAPSVVHITAVRLTFNPWYGTVPQEGTGSGVIINEDGYILTNNHVIKGATTVSVTFHDGSFEEAQVVGTDSFTDLAIIKVEAEIDPSWVAVLGDSDNLRVGQRAIAIGNPFGLDQTLSVGVISALGRPVRTPEAEYDDMIQTDASINPGNSGGPLINSSGEIIGINTSIFSKTGTSLGIGFSIPSNSCRKVAEDIIEFGRVRRSFLGVSTIALNENLARQLGLSVSHGLLVQKVEAVSPAAKADMKAGTREVMFRIGFYTYVLMVDGDIILAIDGENMFNDRQLMNKIKKKTPGDIITVSILRGDQTMDVQVELEIEP